MECKKDFCTTLQPASVSLNENQGFIQDVELGGGENRMVAGRMHKRVCLLGGSGGMPPPPPPPLYETLTTVMKDNQEGQPERAHLCTKGNSCVSAVTFGLGSWSVPFIHWKVYRARAINIQLCYSQRCLK